MAEEKQRRPSLMHPPPVDLSDPPSVAEQARAHFAMSYGGASPRVLVMAPGRVNLIGEHTDYQNGFVCPMALEKYTAIAAGFSPRPNSDGPPIVSCASKGFATGSFAIRPGAMKPLPRDDSSSWMNYLMGVVAQYEALLPRGLDLRLAIVSSVPHGSGLSSSAALETAMAKVVEAVSRLHGQDTGTWDGGAAAAADDRATARARLVANLGGDEGKADSVLASLAGKLNGVATSLRCQKAEHVFGGVMCGIMDQYVSALATKNNAIMIDCYSLACYEVSMPADVAVIVTQTKVQHSLGDSAYNERVRECNEAVRILNLAFPGVGFTTLRDVDDVAQLEEAFERVSARGECKPAAKSVVYRRAKHVVGENARVAAFRDAMGRGDFQAAGAAMYASHDSLRDDYAVSCAELDELVEIARELGPAAGVIGARMTGGGFGGCTVTMVEAARADALCAQIESQYLALHPEKRGGGPLAFVTAAGRGAGILEPMELAGGIYAEKTGTSGSTR